MSNYNDIIEYTWSIISVLVHMTLVFYFGSAYFEFALIEKVRDDQCVWDLNFDLGNIASHLPVRSFFRMTEIDHVYNFYISVMLTEWKFWPGCLMWNQFLIRHWCEFPDQIFRNRIWCISRIFDNRSDAIKLLVIQHWCYCDLGRENWIRTIEDKLAPTKWMSFCGSVTDSSLMCIATRVTARLPLFETVKEKNWKKEKIKLHKHGKIWTRAINLDKHVTFVRDRFRSETTRRFWLRRKIGSTTCCSHSNDFQTNTIVLSRTEQAKETQTKCFSKR